MPAHDHLDRLLFPGADSRHSQPFDGGAARAREARIKEAADPDCALCRGRGFTTGYVAADKYASYPCRCTGIPEVE